MIKLKTLLLEDTTKKLRVFDMDDTLVTSKSRVLVIKPNGEKQFLTPGEFAVYKRQPGEELDFSEFSRLIDPREIKAMVKIFRRFYNAGGQRRMTILTARNVERPARDFLNDAGFTNVEIVALGDSDPQKKASWIEERILDGYNDVFFVDDSYENIAAVLKLKTKYPRVRWEIRLAKYR